MSTKIVFAQEIMDAVPDLASVTDDVKETARRFGVGLKDASETLVFARQLEHIKNRLYKKQYAQLKGTSLVPMSTEAGPNKEFMTYRVWDRFTMAKLVTNYQTDFETVTAVASEVFLKFYDFGNAYEYSQRDVELAASAGVPLSTMKADACREGHELALDEAIAIGIPQVKTYGLLNHPNIQLLSFTTGNWPAATGEQIVADMEGAVTQMMVSTLEIHAPDTFVMSTAALRLVATKAFNSASGDKTVLQVFKDRNPGISVESWTKLTNASAPGNNGRILVYKKAPEILEFEVGEYFRQYSPREVGMSLVVPAMSRLGGLALHQPGAVASFDNQLV